MQIKQQNEYHIEQLEDLTPFKANSYYFVVSFSIHLSYYVRNLPYSCDLSSPISDKSDDEDIYLMGIAQTRSIQKPRDRM